MRVALVNPNWTYDGSIYFGCREPHLPTELGCARALLREAGHEVLLVDAHLYQLGHDELRARVGEFGPDMLVVTTAPTYLFWRCPPPELRVPRRALRALAGSSPLTVAVGPHPSTTPRAAMRKLGVDVAVIGECEEVLVALAGAERRELSSIAWRTDDDAIVVQGGPAACDLARTPALRWTRDDVARHRHHHHRFEAPPSGPGAEVEATRGCPYHCTFCNKENFRNAYRKRPLSTVLDEIDGLIAIGVEYIYFIDEIFLPDRALLEGLVERPVRFGVQMRIDNWSEPMLELLGGAGCLSIEAGVESLTERGRSLLGKRCKLTTDELTALLVYAKKSVPFVQANLLDGGFDDPAAVEAWRGHLSQHGVWANKPVPMFAYPGTPDYRMRWGMPDDDAWERAHGDYLSRFAQFSDIQETRPLPLPQLESDA
ncbi:MAG TPA: TIGR04295 family B12-binding domain-containing radical SAM protein [Polyangia bacterium]